MMSTAIDIEETGNGNAIFQCRCIEKHELVDRNVYQMLLTPENLQRFWNECKQFPTLYGHVLSVEKFAELFLDEGPGGLLRAKGLFWVVDDFVGVFYLTNIYVGVDAMVHYAFFDRCHNGREKLVRKMINYVFREYKFHRLSAELPAYAKDSGKFAEEMGFKLEGRKRSARWYKGEWFDVNLYGIINPYVSANDTSR